jgi:DNA (cytosine-5)-methyltransferase 1
VENVAALLNRGMGRVLGDLAGCGYDAEWDCIPASFIGAPHQRDRVFLIAYPCGEFGKCGRILHGQDDIPRNPEWYPTENLKSGHRWKRWIVQACQDMDRHDPNRFFCGVDDGLSEGLDALRGLGNAVVPGVAQWIGGRINASLNR